MLTRAQRFDRACERFAARVRLTLPVVGAIAYGAFIVGAWALSRKLEGGSLALAPVLFAWGLFGIPVAFELSDAFDRAKEELHALKRLHKDNR